MILKTEPNTIERMYEVWCVIADIDISWVEYQWNKKLNYHKWSPRKDSFDRISKLFSKKWITKPLKQI